MNRRPRKQIEGYARLQPGSLVLCNAKVDSVSATRGWRATLVYDALRVFLTSAPLPTASPTSLPKRAKNVDYLVRSKNERETDAITSCYSHRMGLA
jgi:hypothetical protein